MGINNITIIAPIGSENTDGVDVYGSPVWIHDCYFDNGDDNVAVHANDTLIENCRFGTGHGASIGSIPGGWITNITFRNIQFNGTDNGIRIKTDQNVKEGRLWDVHYENLNMNNVKYDTTQIVQTYNSNTGGESQLYIDGVTIENVTSVGSEKAGTIVCQKSTPCKNIVLKNVKIDATEGFQCEYAYGSATDTTPQSCLQSE